MTGMPIDSNGRHDVDRAVNYRQSTRFRFGVVLRNANSSLSLLLLFVLINQQDATKEEDVETGGEAWLPSQQQGGEVPRQAVEEQVCFPWYHPWSHQRALSGVLQVQK